MAAVQSQRGKRWPGLLFDVLLGVLPGVSLLLYSALTLYNSFETLRSEDLGGAVELFLLGTSGTLACLSLLTVLLRFDQGTQASLTPRMAAFLRWGLVVGVCLSAGMLLSFFVGFGVWLGGDILSNILVFLFLAPTMVAIKYIWLLRGLGGKL